MGTMMVVVVWERWLGYASFCSFGGEEEQWFYSC